MRQLQLVLVIAFFKAPMSHTESGTPGIFPLTVDHSVVCPFPQAKTAQFKLTSLGVSRYPDHHSNTWAELRAGL